MFNKELTIFSVFHKKYPQPNCDFIKPIQVGKALTNVDLGFLKDNTGENISIKNETFCELTALYWIWKNIDKIDSNYIGLSHYRRYLTLTRKKEKSLLFFTYRKTDKKDTYVCAFTHEELDNIASAKTKSIFLATLNEGKLIVPKPAPLRHKKTYDFNIKDNFIYHHIMEDWLLLEKTLIKVCPEYDEFAHVFFRESKEMHCYNMFIGSKQFLKEYCAWLFPILEELERIAKPSGYAYQKRLFGFIAERLFNLYIKRNNIPLAPFPVIFFK